MKRTMMSALAVMLALPLLAVPTTVTVRAISHDAKVIGSGVGGARITIREIANGRLLAQGLQEGGTGDTAKIMKEPHARRGAPYAAGEATAAFVASVDIDEPTRVEIVAEGPMKYPQAIQRTSKTMLLVPGQHITGEGVLLELHGFIVDIQEATAEKVRIKLNMACGCPIEPAGIWDANAITVVARLVSGKKVVVEKPMKFAGETSIFETSLVDAPAGTWELQVIASDAANANFGLAKRELVIAPRMAKE